MLAKLLIKDSEDYLKPNLKHLDVVIHKLKLIYPDTDNENLAIEILANANILHMNKKTGVEFTLIDSIEKVKKTKKALVTDYSFNCAVETLIFRDAFCLSL